MVINYSSVAGEVGTAYTYVQATIKIWALLGAVLVVKKTVTPATP